MLDVQLLRDHPEKVRNAIRAKNAGDPALVDTLLTLDAQRREALTEMQAAQAEANRLARDIGALMAKGEKDAAQQRIQESGRMKARVKQHEEHGRDLDARFQRLMLELPNVPHPSVPVGATPDDNVVAFEWGEKPTFAFEPKPHWELLDTHGLVDFERGVKVTGAGFPVYVGKGARLQRALIQFFLDRAGDDGYVEIQPPHLVNEASGIGTGQIPDKEGMMYETERDGLYLIPTAEVPVTNLHRDEVLETLPVRYAAYTPCFRREAGSYGKDVRGLNRLHQFDKVERVLFVAPEQSYDALEALRDEAEGLIQALGLPYRRLLMCTGDMGVTQAKKYDLEVWSPGQQRWLEVSSVSNFEAFQARRANVRFRDADGKLQHVHTLNGSALALPRILAALLEHHQQEDGRIVVPEVLRPYAGFDVIGG